MLRPSLPRSCLAACLLAVLSASDTWAAGETIPTIVVTPSQTPAGLEQVPQAVSVLDRRDFARQGLASVQDAVEDMPGANLSRSSFAGGFASLFLRGTESSHTLVLLDGLPINDPASTNGAFNFSEDLLGSLDRLEVVRGPSSVLYGSSAIGGVVNLISRKPTQAFEPQADLYAGSYGTAGGSGTVSGQSGAWGYVLSAEGQHTDGFVTLPRRFPNNSRDPKGSDTEAAFGKVTYDVNDAMRLFGQLRWRNLDFALNDVPNNSPHYRGASAFLNGQLGAEHDWLGKRMRTAFTYGETRTDRSYHDDPTPLAYVAGSPLLRASYKGVRHALNAQNRAHLPDMGALQHLALVTGVNRAWESTTIDYRSDSAYGPFNQTVEASTRQTGIFSEIQGSLAERIDLTAGLRRDFPEDYDDHTSARLGGVLQLPEIAGRIRSSWGTAYRTPSLYERFGVDSFGRIGNPALRPETAESWDAGFEKDFARKKLIVASTYFETSTRNLIDYNFGAVGQYYNVARTEISGVENSAKLRPLSWLETEASWTWLHAINASGQTYAGTPEGKALLRRPSHTASGSITVWPTPAWRITPRIRFVGPRYDQLYDDTGTFIGRGRVGGYTLMDMTSDYRLTEHVSLYSRMRNLLNRRVEAPNGYLQEPLMVMLGVRYE